MKKYINITIAIALTALLSGCGIRFGVESRNNSGITENDSSNSGESISISETITDINKLDIKIDVSNIKINYYDGENVNISGKLSKYSKGLRTEKKSNSLIIIEESKNSKNLKADYSSDLVIDIPRKFNGDFEFAFGVGEGEINDLELNNMKISSGVGELILKEISFDKLELKSGVGETTLESSKKTGEISIEGGIGETNVSLGNINGNLKFDGGMGSATIKVPVNAPINITSEAGLGDVKITAKTSNEGKYTFDVSVGLGDIKITN
ncbi:MAG: DUF4097 family beta strand repeat protein [Clostridium sp.]|uniref:DUF4097 family beta strand repeat-containing protein n=1 Tax=Clostridium sp. TaxID=1506 RepID=UPI0025C405B9|nr:DUF4097 family beta strand repeat-containing protein [Clostridium sp.]MCF0148819.1 DUF4097 family beta strand repeat protein [Clostridium sp.]